MQPLEYFLTDSHQYCAENNVIHRYLLENIYDDYIRLISNYTDRQVPRKELIILAFNHAYAIIDKMQTEPCPQSKIEDYFLSTTFDIAEHFGMKNCKLMEIPHVIATHAMSIAYGIMELTSKIHSPHEGARAEVLSTMHHYDYPIDGYYNDTSFHKIFRAYNSFLWNGDEWNKLRNKWIHKIKSSDEYDWLPPEPWELVNNEAEEGIEVEEPQNTSVPHNAQDIPEEETVKLQIGQGKNIREVPITAARAVQCVKDSGHQSKLSNKEWEKLLASITTIKASSFHNYW